MDTALDTAQRATRAAAAPVTLASTPRFGLTLDPSAQVRAGGIRPFQHNYHQHPLMQLDALEQLAIQLAPSFQCRFMKPGIDPTVPFDHSPRPPDGRSISDVFRRLHEPGSWIALYDVQTQPEYQAFVDGVLAGASSMWPSDEVLDVRGFIFLSAPPSVTPFHIDGELNFWMQLHGRKTMHVWDRTDAAVVTDRDVERFVMHRALDNVRLDDAKLARSMAFDCGPGDGVFFPSTTPHMTRSTDDWVEPGNGVTVSIGVVFYTRSSVLEARAHACNAVLRALGANPTRVGRSAQLDRFKAPIGQAVVSLAQRLKGYRPTESYQQRKR